MITAIVHLVAFLVENCTGVAITETQGKQTDFEQGTNLQSSLLEEPKSCPLQDFITLDPEDVIFQEFDPPKYLENEPQAWKINLPTFKKSFWECLKTVLLIQGLAVPLTGIIAVIVIFLDFHTAEWCYDESWTKIPKNVQRLKITVKCLECFLIQVWDFFFLCILFPFSLIRELNVHTLILAGCFLDVVLRLYIQMYGVFKGPWLSIPLDSMFGFIMMVNHYRLARHLHPHSMKDALKFHFVITLQLFLAVPVWFVLVYEMIPFYLHRQKSTKLIIAALYPLLTLIPKAVSRLAAQSDILKEVIHPGSAHILVAVTYGVSAVVFRVLQAELTSSIGLFIALGIAHAIIDLLERITITMRDHIWEHLYRLVRRQGSKQPKYRSLRSRRLIADVSIQIMMHEASALMIGLGFFNIYQFIYGRRSYTIYQCITDFLTGTSIGLAIDMTINTLSLLIQTRLINLPVNRVWKKKWRHHILANSLIAYISVLFFSEHLFQVIRDKYDSHLGFDVLHGLNCSFPIFL
ncbi:uncharacterized protein LOC116288987 [Actinia tenebrosa]|uniref:Uncharacterized protein LOC116288987 n=1 Tax=Actinia tenebrosa TaxID=6105 RepID=A0A6P8HGL7_ACTTE|nr:uncharacterized protein LOC116288987 [Actinia tenebrosa]